MKTEAVRDILILVAGSEEKDRNFIAGVLQTHGFQVLQAIDGGTAIRVIEDHDVDVAIVNHRMKPNDGFEVAQHILVKGYRAGTIMLTDDPDTDLLIEAGHLGVSQVMRKPAEIDRLIEAIKRILRKQGKNPDALYAGQEVFYRPEALMERAIALARQNARAQMGGPFAAIVTDARGHILGEGMNGVKVRCDPTAHAEVLAIRRAAERLGSTQLEGCVIYCSAEPTLLGRVLIIGTGIQKVYYGIGRYEVCALPDEEEGIGDKIASSVTALEQSSVVYEQMMYEQALAAWQEWLAAQASGKGD